MWKLGAAILLTSATALAAPAKLNLEQTVLYAVEHSPSLNSIARQATVSRYERKNTFAAFLPSLDLTANHGIRRDQPLTNTNPWTSDFSLDLTETLYDNGKNITQYKIAKLTEMQANLRFLLERDKLCRDVAQQFLAFSQSVKALEVQEEQFNTLKKEYSSVASGFRQGWKTERDYLRLKGELNRTEIDIVAAQNAVLKAKEHLRNVIGLGLEAENFDFQPVGDRPLSGKIPAKPLALSEHRLFQISKAQNEIGELQTSLARRAQWPELTLTAGADYRSANYLGHDAPSFRDNDRLEWNALLGVKFNLLDWGTRSRNAAIAVERQYIEENQTSSELYSLREELSTLMLDIQEKRRSYELSQEVLKLELQNFRNLSVDYRQGKIGYLDYINGLQVLSGARLRYYSSLYDLQQGIYSYQYHQGTLYEAIKK
jgi:outer membrane protein TolC